MTTLASALLLEIFRSGYQVFLSAIQIGKCVAQPNEPFVGSALFGTLDRLLNVPLSFIQFLSCVATELVKFVGLSVAGGI